MVARFWPYPILFAGFFSLGLLRPELPGILLELFEGVMSNVATFQGVCDGFSALFAFFAVPFLGNFCDGVGRKPGLTISAVCSSAPIIILCAYQLFSLPKTLTLILYFLGNFICRVTTQSVVFSYIADCSSIEKRSAALVEAGGVLYLAQTAGPTVAKYLSRQNSLLIGSALCLAGIAYSFVLPESHHPNAMGNAASYGSITDAEKGSATSVPPQGNQQHNAHQGGQGKGVFVGLKFLATTRLYIAIAAILLCSQMAMSGVGQIYYLYLTEEFHFQRTDNLLCAMIGGAQTCVIMLLIQPRLTKFVSLSTAMAFAMANYCVYCLGLSFIVRNREEVFLLIIFYGFAAVMFSSTNALLASVTMPHQLGLAMGALAAIKAFASGFGSLLFGVFFGAMVRLKQSHGEFLFGALKTTSLPLLVGCIMAGCVVVACLFLPLDRKSASKKWKDSIINVITMHRVLSAAGAHTNNEEYHYLPSHIALPNHLFKRLEEELHALNPSTKPPPSPASRGGQGPHPPRAKLFWHHDTKGLPRTPKFVSGDDHEEADVLAVPRPPDRSGPERLQLGLGLAAFVVIALFACKGIGHAIEKSPSQAVVFPLQAMASPARHQHLAVIALLGPPGVGKSALSRHISPDFDFVHVGTGDLIRDEINAKTEIGNRTAAIVHEGKLVDDETVTLLIEKRLHTLNSSARGIILDGFPRRLSQAKLLDSGKFDIPRLAAVVSVTMPDDILDIRRSGRRICPVCGATYNLHEVDQDGFYLKARLPCNGRCCNENATLVTRPDDDEKIAADRMRVYHEENPAMVAYYRAAKILIEVEKKRQMKILYKELKPELSELVHIDQKRQKKHHSKSD